MTATLTNPLRVGLRQERVISPQCLVIFGASGDLTHRKLIPALFDLFRQRRLPSEFAVLGCARRPWSDEEFRQKMEVALAAKIADDPEAWSTFSSGLFYEPVDLQKQDDVVRLGKRLEQIDRQRATRSNRTFYLSVSPAFYGSGCRALAGAGLLADPKRSRVVIEKPFGRDYASAQELNRVVKSCGQRRISSSAQSHPAPSVTRSRMVCTSRTTSACGRVYAPESRGTRQTKLTSCSGARSIR